MFSKLLLNLDTLITNWQYKQVDILEFIEISDIVICVIKRIWEMSITVLLNVLNQIFKARNNNGTLMGQ